MHDFQQELTEETEVLLFPISVNSVCSCRVLFFICDSGEDQAVNPVGQFHFMEIDEQPKRDIQQFHVAQELRFVDGQNLLYGLCFHQHTTFHQHIESRFLSREALVFNHHEFLAHAWQPTQLELLRQTP